MEGGGHWRTCPLGWKLLSCSQCQELGQRANLAPDWLPENKEPIRSQVSSLTKLLTLTTTQKFPSHQCTCILSKVEIFVHNIFLSKLAVQY